MKKINKITIKYLPDYDADLSYLGTFDNEQKSEYAINHEPDNSRVFNWFNPQETTGDTPRNLRKYAKQNYERIMQYERGNWSMYGIKAEAKIATDAGYESWLLNEITSGGLWGLESDMDDASFKQVEDEQLDELKDVLRQIGFTDKEINATPIENERKAA